jgi:hypothetical protein
VTWLPVILNADKVVNVELVVPVTLEAVPVVLWFKVGKLLEIAAATEVPLPYRIPVTVVDNVMAGVEVGLATEPANPLVDVTDTDVTVPTPLGYGTHCGLVPFVLSKYPETPVWVGSKASMAVVAVVCPVPPCDIGTTPVTWAKGRLRVGNEDSVLLEVAVILEASPAMLPDTWLPGRLNADRVVKVELEVAVMLEAVPAMFPDTWEPGKVREGRVVRVELEVAVIFEAVPEILPVTWLPGKLNADRVVNVLLEVAVMFAAVPVVFWLRMGISAGTINRKVGAPALPLGAAKNVFADWLFNEDRVSVPALVTGLPVMLNNPVESARPTAVTVPPLLVEVIIIVEPSGVIVMPAPGTRVSAPDKSFRLLTPDPEPPSSGRSM